MVLLLGEDQIVEEECLNDIANIFISNELSTIFDPSQINELIGEADGANVTNSTGTSSKKDICQKLLDKVRSNLHVLICMDPFNSQFRNRCRKFRSLFNNCTIDWFMKWPRTAFHTAALTFFTEMTENEQHNNSVARICVAIHEQVETAAERLLPVRSRHLFICPNNFLDLMELYRIHLKQRSEQLVGQRTRIANGLNKILDTNEMVVVMQEELKTLTPMIDVQSKEIDRLVLRLANDTKVADDFRTKMLQEEAEAKEKEIITRAIADDANCDLEVATPSLKTAQEALKAINKNDLNELKALSVPPPLAMFVLEAVCVLMGLKPVWDSAKKMLGDPNFTKKLLEFDKEQISDVTLKKIKTYVEHKDFDPMVTSYTY